MAHQAYVSIKGTKQGQFKPKSGKTGSREKWIPILAFDYGVESPRDTATGEAAGKRQHSPITVTKETGYASPQIFQAHWTDEVLSEVVIQTVLGPLKSSGSVAPEPVAERITLTNATISKVERYTSFPMGVVHHPKEGYQSLEFNFQDIKVVKLGA